ncbi:MAG: START domain-containing protein [Chitinophagaceae bacterium]
MKCKAIVGIVLCLLVGISVNAQDGWVLKKDQYGIKVFTRKMEHFKFVELKVECEFNGKLSQLAAVLLDAKNHYRWVYKTIKSSLLTSADTADIFFYNEIESPWPLTNRDIVVHMSVLQNAKTKVMTVEGKNDDNILPGNSKMVRVKYSSVLWTVTPLNDHQFKVDYRLLIDPGGSVPAWLVNMSISKGPFESFMKLKEEIGLPQYVNARFSFIKDW